MKKVFILAAAAVVLALAGAQAQERPRTETTESVSLYLPYGVGLHYAYEHPLGRLGTITGRAGVDAGAAWGYNMLGGDRGFWAIAPSIDIEPRFYYGLDRRAARGHGTSGNAGSFLAMQMKNVMPFGYISDSDLTVVGATSFTPMWGMRRVWGGSWLFEFTAGATLAWGWRGGFLTSPHCNVRFGYSF
ncbi:MAG: hypothetical protein LBU98_03990 [Alistipes sp.]|nr:hypothetical protein [Alistipes sp.]